MAVDITLGMLLHTPANQPIGMSDNLNGTYSIKTRNGMEHYGATIADRPDASSVPVGATFMIVGDLSSMVQSDGTNWVEMT